jgi:hypothetical protein
MVKGIKIRSAIKMKLKSFFKCISLVVLLFLAVNMLYARPQRDSGSSYQRIYCNLKYYYLFLISLLLEKQRKMKQR